MAHAEIIHEDAVTPADFIYGSCEAIFSGDDTEIEAAEFLYREMCTDSHNRVELVKVCAGVLAGLLDDYEPDVLRVPSARRAWLARFATTTGVDEEQFGIARAVIAQLRTPERSSVLLLNNEGPSLLLFMLTYQLFLVSGGKEREAHRLYEEYVAAL